jgi:hypothetical protein
MLPNGQFLAKWKGDTLLEDWQGDALLEDVMPNSELSPGCLPTTSCGHSSHDAFLPPPAGFALIDPPPPGVAANARDPQTEQ